jgi:hypothetical protein
MNKLTGARIITIADGLVSEDGENPEYDRAIVEFTCELLGLEITESFEAMERIICGRSSAHRAPSGKNSANGQGQITYGSPEAGPDESEVAYPAYLVQCPRCAAPKYQECWDMRPGRDGHIILRPHQARTRLAEKRAAAGIQH